VVVLSLFPKNWKFSVTTTTTSPVSPSNFSFNQSFRHKIKVLCFFFYVFSFLFWEGFRLFGYWFWVLCLLFFSQFAHNANWDRVSSSPDRKKQKWHPKHTNTKTFYSYTIWLMRKLHPKLNNFWILLTDIKLFIWQV